MLQSRRRFRADALRMSPFDQFRQARMQEEVGDWLSAAATYDHLAEQDPDDHRLRTNQANALWLADLPAAAASSYQRALVLQPLCPVSQRGLASCLRDLNRFEEALQLHQQLAMHLPPGSPDAQANLWAHSQILIGLQHFSDAFERMACRKFSPLGRLTSEQDVLNEQLTVVSEQGFGDSLQYVRFVLPLHDQRQAAGLRGGVRLLVEAPLVELLRQGLSWLDDPPSVECKPSDWKPDDHALTLLTLPAALGVNHVGFTGDDSAYLLAPNWLQRSVRAEGASLTRIGLVSAAGLAGPDPFCRREFEKRSLPAAILWRLADELRDQGAELHDLQYGSAAERHRALGLELRKPFSGLEGFAATARAVAQLDLVITVDTAMAHLAGAMGRACWVLLPWSADPRWLRDGRSTPWYPNTVLFRQPRPGDWHGAVDQLLKFFIAGHLDSANHP